MKDQIKGIILSNGYVLTQPDLIEAGNPRVRLGFNKSLPSVDCRVLAEEGYQELMNEIDHLKSQNKELVEDIENYHSEIVNLESQLLVSEWWNEEWKNQIKSILKAVARVAELYKNIKWE